MPENPGTHSHSGPVTIDRGRADELTVEQRIVVGRIQDVYIRIEDRQTPTLVSIGSLHSEVDQVVDPPGRNRDPENVCGLPRVMLFCTSVHARHHRQRRAQQTLRQPSNQRARNTSATLLT